MIILKVISPVREMLSAEVSLVELPGEKGRFAVLNNHAPLITSLVRGNVRYVLPSGEQDILGISGGFAEVSDNTVTVCTEE